MDPLRLIISFCTLAMGFFLGIVLAMIASLFALGFWISSSTAPSSA